MVHAGPSEMLKFWHEPVETCFGNVQILQSCTAALPTIHFLRSFTPSLDEVLKNRWNDPVHNRQERSMKAPRERKHLREEEEKRDGNQVVGQEWTAWQWVWSHLRFVPFWHRFVSPWKHSSLEGTAMMESVVWWILCLSVPFSLPSWYYLPLLWFLSLILLVNHHSSRFTIPVSVPFLPPFFSSPFLVVLLWFSHLFLHETLTVPCSVVNSSSFPFLLFHPLILSPISRSREYDGARTKEASVNQCTYQVAHVRCCFLK